MNESIQAQTIGSAPVSRSRESLAGKYGNSSDSYENIEPWFDKREALDPDDPHRSQIRDEIIELCLPLAEHIARRFGGRGESFDDLQQVARIGLIQAVDRFDLSHGSTFLAYAVPTIMGEVRRHFRDRTWAVRVPRTMKDIQLRIGPATEALSQRFGRVPTAREVAAELEVDLPQLTQAMVAANGHTSNSLESIARDDDDAGSAVQRRLGNEEPCYGLLEDAMAVRPLIAALPSRERQVLVWRFYGAMTQNQIAERLGVSQMQVSRILSRTLASLREQALAEPAAA
ncbi:RNA polymerase sigma factor SigF [Nocardia cyriacigeorgica]|uniref:RNA polymerase sigma factor SigF n=1 Tax=Nocardia cyriacigeorgica TaxID=135487 RepID=UPI0035C77C1E